MGITHDFPPIVQIRITPFFLEILSDMPYSDVMEHFNARRADFTPYGFTCELWEPHRMPRPDRHEEVEINFLNEGSLIYVLGGNQIRIEPRQLTLFWAALPHQIVAFSDVSSYFVVTVPFDRFLQWGLPETFHSHLLAGDVLCCDDQQQSEIDALQFDNWRRDLNGGDPRMQEVVLHEVQARMMRLSQAVQLNTPTERSSKGSTRNMPQAATLEKAERMACYIARNFKSQLRVADIAESVGLHPDYAATTFRKTFGVTLNTQIARHRVAEVQRKLITTDEPIIDIAYGAGFESMSNFNRTFRAAAGVTPRAYRKQHKG